MKKLNPRNNILQTTSVHIRTTNTIKAQNPNSSPGLKALMLKTLIAHVASNPNALPNTIIFRYIIIIIYLFIYYYI